MSLDLLLYAIECSRHGRAYLLALSGNVAEYHGHFYMSWLDASIYLQHSLPLWRGPDKGPPLAKALDISTPLLPFPLYPIEVMSDLDVAIYQFAL